MKDISKDTSGDFRKLLLGMFADKYQFWAAQINKAIKKNDVEKLSYLIILIQDEDIFDL